MFKSEDIVPQVGDEFVRLNNGSENEPFHGKVIEVLPDKIGVSGKGYIGGCHYGKWWGYLTSLEHVTITKKS